ncbi:MAG: hypothetical protein GQ574_25650 [Crocinitomix sp.]|nr:hypothetical protein [Crocinitomix sp.]
MIDIAAPIIDGNSIGGISIGQDSRLLLSELYSNGYMIEENKFHSDFIEYKVNEGIISFVINSSSNNVINISCKNPYEGSWKNKFTPSMSVQTIIKQSNKTMVLHGFLIIDGIYGVGYNLPNEYDEIDSVDQLPDDLVLEQIYVMDNDWWK